MKGQHFIEYIHLYKNAKIIVIYSKDEAYVDEIGSISYDGGVFTKHGFEGAQFLDDLIKQNAIVKLILTHPLEMSKHQKQEYDKRCLKNTYGQYVVKFDTPVSIKYLLDECIDTFDLIENGVAITEDQLSQLNYELVTYEDNTFEIKYVKHIAKEAIQVIKKPKQKPIIGIVTIDEEYEKACVEERENINESGKQLDAKDFKQDIF